MTANYTKHLISRLFLVTLIMCAALCVAGQEEEIFRGTDSTGRKTITVKDSAVAGEKKKVRVYNPKTAAIRSAILPGLGQIYNKKYWKLPIVYGALGTSAAVFAYNLTWYKRTKFAYKVLVTQDLASYDKVHPQLRRLVDANQDETIKYYRDEYRRDIDYSVLFFVVLWGLNVVDAAVDAHLKAFDVSPDLSIQIKTGRSELAGTHGLSLVVNIGKKVHSRPSKLL